MSLFFDEDEAIEELQKRGYRVTKENYPEARSVSTVKDLVDYFYSRRKFYNPDRKFPFSIDYSSGTKFISSFINSRQKLGLGRKTAIQEAAILIDALFKYEEILGLKTPVISPAILAVRPIMDRVCACANGEVGEAFDLEQQLFVDEINEIYNQEFEERDFEKAAKERQIILEKINGKK